MNLYRTLFAAVCLLAFACSAPEKDAAQEEAETVTAAPVIYRGAKIDDANAIDVSEMLAKVEGQDSVALKVRGKMTDVCKMKGCWMKLDLPGGEQMRVTFKDYGFFVPVDSEESEVVMEGVAFKQETDVETLRHYAQDAGKTEEEIAAITEPKVEYRFEATGVMLIGYEPKQEAAPADMTETDEEATEKS